MWKCLKSHIALSVGWNRLQYRRLSGHQHAAARYRSYTIQPAHLQSSILSVFIQSECSRLSKGSAYEAVVNVQSAVKCEDTMLTKFETKSNRVKGLAFHPKRSASACVYRAMHSSSCSLCLMLAVCAGPGSWRLCTVVQFRYVIKTITCTAFCSSWGGAHLLDCYDRSSPAQLDSA